MAGLLFVVIRHVLVDVLRKPQILGDVAGIRVIRVWTDRELLFMLPRQHTLAPRRIVVAPRGLLLVERYNIHTSGISSANHPPWGDRFPAACPVQ